MEIKRSPGLLLTGLGIVLVLMSVFAPDAPFAPSNLFVPVMLIFFGRVLSRGARAMKRPKPTAIKMPPSVFYPPSPQPRRPARSAPPPAPAPVEVVVPDPSPAASESSDLEEKLRVAQMEAKARTAPEPSPPVEKRPEPSVKPHAPMIVPPAASTAPVYPQPTPSSVRAKSSKEMVEEAKKRLKRG